MPCGPSWLGLGVAEDRGASRPNSPRESLAVCCCGCGWLFLDDWSL